MDAVPGREVLSSTDIARRFDSNLLDPTLSDEQLIAGCHRAIELGLAAVVCRPERVATAARATEGSDVAVCTGLNVRDDTRLDVSLPDLTEAADRAVADGVRDLTLLVAAAQLQDGNADVLAEQISVIAASAARRGGKATGHPDDLRHDRGTDQRRVPAQRGLGGRHRPGRLTGHG